MNDYVQDAADGCVLRVKVHPGAKRSAVTAVLGESLKIALSAPPVDGKANDALIAFVAEALGLPKARVMLTSGMTSRSKTLRITGKSAAEVKAVLDPTISA
ncbi:MAG TPA: DUF167 domain-containing protein [Granulicella sp.]